MSTVNCVIPILHIYFEDVNAFLDSTIFDKKNSSTHLYRFSLEFFFCSVIILDGSNNDDSDGNLRKEQCNIVSSSFSYYEYS
jgi:hypothetical protein